MNNKPLRCLSMLLAALLIAPWSVLTEDRWVVNVRHDLNGGQWEEHRAIYPRSMEANIGESMDPDSLSLEKVFEPYQAGCTFAGWSVLFTSAENGAVIYDSGYETWDLNHPFDYYPDNPQNMNCLMTARWRAIPALPQATLPDGRAITWPFAAGTEPLPETPPPCDQIIQGTTWLRDALICGMDEGVKAPVFSFPVYNGPVIDWVGLDDSMDYGLYLGEGWVMLYNPKWVEASGIGFIDHTVIDFPGAEEGGDNP